MSAYVRILVAASLLAATGHVAEAANTGIDGADSVNYPNGWITGSGPTGPEAPFGTWTVATAGHGAADISSGEFRTRSAQTPGNGASVTAERSFNGGHLMPGQSFAFRIKYRWVQTSGGHRVQLLDGTATLMDLVVVNKTSDHSEARFRTPAGVDLLVIPQGSSAWDLKNVDVTMTIGAGENAGKARLTTTGTTTFDSGWVVYEGSPDRFEVFTSHANANTGYQVFFDNFEVSGTPVLPATGTVILLR